MKSIVSVELGAQSGEQVEDLGLRRHVERRGDLVGDDDLGARRPERGRSRCAAADRPRTRAGSGRLGRSTDSRTVERRARSRSRWRRTRACSGSIASARVCPIVRRGSSDEYGSCGISWIRRRSAVRRLVAPAVTVRCRRRGSARRRRDGCRRSSSRSSTCPSRTRRRARRSAPPTDRSDVGAERTRRAAVTRARRRDPWTSSTAAIGHAIAASSSGGRGWPSRVGVASSSEPRVRVLHLARCELGRRQALDDLAVVASRARGRTAPATTPMSCEMNRIGRAVLVVDALQLRAAPRPARSHRAPWSARRR